MKYKITKRLIGYFSVVLLIFSVIIGVLFQILFTRHTAEINQQELKKRAISIADTLSQFHQEQGGRGNGMGMGNGYGAYLRFIDDIAMSKVWLVDEKAQRIEIGHKGSSLSYDDIPDGAEELIQQVFQGNTLCSQKFGQVPGFPCVTAGVPVRDENGDIFAALLLHSPVEGMEQAQKDGTFILVCCILAALIFATGLSVILARHFIRPLQIMAGVTGQIIKGSYVHTGIIQNDEIGMLASNIDELSERLSGSEAERKELDKMRQDFMSNISHELRTPVTVIKGSLEVLCQGLVTGGEEKEYLHQMFADISQLQRLVNDLLELSRLQNISFKIEKTKINLTDVLNESIRSIRQLASKKNIVMNLSGSVQPFPFYGDYGRIRQMFTIVLDNAVKFSPDGSCIDIKIQSVNSKYVIVISDYGKGIPAGDIPHVFERFYREQSGQNKNGSGLGLSIAKQIAQRHNTVIECESEYGKGTSFIFTFPGGV